MKAKFQRTLRSGTEYDALIPRSSGSTIVKRASADTHDTIELIKRVVGSSLDHTSQLTPRLRGSDLRATCKAVWGFVYAHIQYKNDTPGIEQIRTPARIWADRKTGVDCDDYSVFVSSLLTNLHIDHAFRVTDYGKGWQHIYVVVPVSRRSSSPLDQARRDAYIVIDCVPDQFDFEVRYTKKMDFTMQLHQLSGLGNIDDGQDGLAGKRAQARAVPGQNSPAQRRTLFGKALQKVSRTVMKVNPATLLIRNGVLLAMKLNFKGLSRKLRFAYATSSVAAKHGYSQDSWKRIYAQLIKLQNTFVKAGGEAEALKSAILKGKGNQNKAVPLSGLEYVDIELDGLGLLDPVTLTAISAGMAALAPLIMALKGVSPDPNSVEYAEQATEEQEEAPEEEYEELGKVKLFRKKVAPKSKPVAVATRPAPITITPLAIRQAPSTLSPLLIKQAQIGPAPMKLPAVVMPVAVPRATANTKKPGLLSRILRRKKATAATTPAAPAGPTKKQVRQTKRADRKEIRQVKKADKQVAKTARQAIPSPPASTLQKAQAFQQATEFITPTILPQRIPIANTGIVNPMILNQQEDDTDEAEYAESAVVSQSLTPLQQERKQSVVDRVLTKASNAVQTASQIMQTANKVYAPYSGKPAPILDEAEVIGADQAPANPPAQPPTPPGKIDWKTAGLVGLGALLVGKLFFGGSSNDAPREKTPPAPTPPNPTPPGLSGAPRRSRRKKANGLRAVPLS